MVWRITVALILKNNWLPKTIKEQKNYAKANTKPQRNFFCKIGKGKDVILLLVTNMKLCHGILNWVLLLQAAYH